MAYCLKAVLGEFKRLQAAASAMPPSVVVPLADGLGLIPLTKELFDSIGSGSTENHEETESQHFAYLSTQAASWLKALSACTTVAYVEAEFFGGVGDQCAVGWQDGIEVLPPTKAKDAINQVLRLLGVRAASGQDEFDTVRLGRHRTIEGWVDEGLARKRMALDPKSGFVYPPFVEANESFRRFLRDQGCSDKIRWLWREDICTRRVPGSQRSWNRSVFVNLARSSETSLVEDYYNFGVGRNHGIALEVFCIAAGCACCFMYLPEDETDAAYHMLSGLKLTVPERPTVARVSTNLLVWAALRLFMGVPKDPWIQEIPSRIDAERLVGRSRGVPRM